MKMPTGLIELSVANERRGGSRVSIQSQCQTRHASRELAAVMGSESIPCLENRALSETAAEKRGRTNWRTAMTTETALYNPPVLSASGRAK
ncbi:hypothetical protein DdX_01176 [Ditylenchus destructor]|uniref:Uncharacterized protein n=1 Tax=Ditylenchus destructor TaxID=166010 RepID=A0AAD4NGG9_9BILA|nr:hypothetical protein DdX_01176 [Ditylenchus destructor]